MDENVSNWLMRAESNLTLAIQGKTAGVMLEDLCFETQQSVEKALKALLIHLTKDFPKVHSFVVLLKILGEHVKIPLNIHEVTDLSDYAVQGRYPGSYTPVTEDEYNRAVSIAQDTLDWVKETISGGL